MEHISEMIQTSKDIFTTREVAYYIGITEEEVRYYTKIFEPVLPIRKVSRTMRIYTKQDICKLLEMISYAENQKLSAKEVVEYFLENPMIESMREQKELRTENLEKQIKILIELISNIQAEQIAATKEEGIAAEKDVRKTSFQRLFHKK